MHGRHAERETIARLLAETRDGRGGALILGGDAGIGKSALLRHAAELATGGPTPWFAPVGTPRPASGAARRAEPGTGSGAATVADTWWEPMRVLACAGVESEVTQAFSGLHALLRPVLGRVDALPEVQADALRGALGVAETPASDFLVAAAVLTLLSTAADERPLLVLVDDVQWLDHASATALLFAARRLGGERVAMLLAARDHEPRPVTMTGLPELTLRGLPPEDAALLLSARGWELPAREREALVRATGGNPLALIELAGLDEPERTMPDLAVTGTLPVGARVRAAFLRQVEALPPDGRSLLLVAAAEESGDANTVLGAAARLGLPSDALVPAERSGLVALDGAEFRFRHPLIRSAVYAAVPAERRRAAHLAIAEHLSAEAATIAADLAGAGGGGGDAERHRAAWHRALTATAPDEDLAAALERGSDAARRRGGEAAAVSVLQQAARLSESPADRRRRTVTAAFVALDAGRPDLARSLVEQVMAEPEPVPAVTLAQLNGTIELYSGDPAVAFSHLMRCAELMAATDPEEAAWTYTLASSAAYHAGEISESASASRRIADLDCAPATHRAAEGLSGAMSGAIVGTDLWELPVALAQSQPGGGERPWMWASAIAWLGPDSHQALRLTEATARRVRAAGSPAALTELLYYQADIEFRVGRWDEGIEHAHEGLRFSYETGQQGWTANLQAILARFAAARGEAAECRMRAEQALKLALPLRQRSAAATATGALGLLALGMGEPGAAFAEFIRMTDRTSLRSNDHITFVFLPDLVEAAVRAGSPEPAARVAEGVHTWTGSFRTSVVSAHRHRCRAPLAEVEDPEGGQAEAHYRGALAEDGLEQRPFDRARTELLYGDWLRRRQRRNEARPLLRSAAETFDALGAAPWAERARTQIRAAGGSAQVRTSTAAEVLSPQELEVVRLASAGLKNREIGERMHLSPRTVGSHLYRAFPKLGISTRSQLRGLNLG